MTGSGIASPQAIDLTGELVGVLVRKAITEYLNPMFDHGRRIFPTVPLQGHFREERDVCRRFNHKWWLRYY